MSESKSDNFVVFPPFPNAPQGTIIRPFDPAEWKLILSKRTDDGSEYDAIGIKTLDFLVEPNYSAATSAVEKPVQVTWIQSWEATETQHWREGKLVVAQACELDEKLLAALETFEKAMKWPPVEHGIRERGWNGLRKFLGLMTSNLPVKIYKPVDDGNRHDVIEDDDDSEDEDQVMTGLPSSSHPDAPSVYEPLLDLPDTKAAAFLRNPKHAMAQFLSSYMLAEGLLDAPKWLTAVPLLVKFFLNYLIHVQVLADSRGFSDALDIVTLAEKELIQTWEFTGSFLKDEYREICNICFGNPQQAVWNISSDEKGEPVRKKAKLQTESDSPVSGWDTVKDGGWDSNPSGSSDTWGEPSLADTGGWGTGPSDPDDGWDVEATDGWGNCWGNDTANAGMQQDISSLSVFKRPEYPSWLPNKYTPGIVERSWRRVKAIRPPERVDNENFLGKYHQLILEPWDLEPPTIEKAGDVGHQHDPLRDEIIVLVGAETASFAFEGMGLQAYWIELVGEEKPRFWYSIDLLRAVPSYYTNL